MTAILAFSLSAGTSTKAQNPDNKPVSTQSTELAEWIMKIVVDKGEQNEKIKRRQVTYNKVVTKSDMGKNPPQIKETSVYEIFGRDEESLELLKEKNGRPIRNAQPEKGKFNPNVILLERYMFDLIKIDFINGRGYYMIAFKPKEPIDQLPFNDRMDEGINRAAGYLQIDMEKFYLVRMEGKLINKFSKALSIFEMKDFVLIFEQEEFEGVVVPKYMSLIYKYRVFWGDTHEKLEYVYNNRKFVP